jgi:hypothetical protein
MIHLKYVVDNHVLFEEYQTGFVNHLHGLLVGMIMGLIPSQVKPKTIKFVFAASQLDIQHKGVRVKTGWLRV